MRMWWRITPGRLATWTMRLALGCGCLLALVAGMSPARAAASSSGGATPHAALSAYTLDFGVQTLGATRALSVTLTNTGLGDLHLRAIGGLRGSFGVSGTCAAPTVLAPGASCVASVTFSPSVFGVQQAGMTFLDDAADAQTVTLVGVGTAAILDSDVTRLDFGVVFLGSAATRTATLTNRGDSPLLVSGISLGGDAASEADTCRSAAVAPGGSCAVTVRFAPTAASTLVTTLRIDSNAVRGPLMLPISGSGAAPVVALHAEPLTFGGQPIGAYTERPLVVTNTGTDDLIMSDVRVANSSDAFTVTAENCLRQPLRPAASCTITVRFKPKRVSDERATLIVYGNMPSGAAVYSLTGSGLAPIPLQVQSASPRLAAVRAAAETLRLWVTLLAETCYLSLACLLAAVYLKKRNARLKTQLALAAPRVTNRLSSPVAASESV